MAIKIKKPAPKRDPASPNTVLVIFLAFFVLATIVFGVLTYMGYTGQEEPKKKEQQANVLREGAKLGQDYADKMLREYRFALGFAAEERDEDRNDIDANIGKLEGKGAEFQGRFRAEKNLAAMLEDINKLRAELGYDGEPKTYQTTFSKRLKELRDDNDKLRGKLTDQAATLAKLEQVYKSIGDDSKASWAAVMKKIEEGNKEALDLANVQLAEMKKVQDFNKELQLQKEKVIEEHRKVVERIEDEKRKLEFTIDKLKTDVKNASNPVLIAARPLSDPHALVLDISTGKPLWDKPVGKISRVDPKEQHVYLNIGSAQGVKPQLTFTVFGPGWLDRAEKTMKGSLEVIRVLDKNSSVARITSLYDGDGFEIALNDPNRIRREAANAMKEGDLLFNAVWGARVAIAGPVNWNGLPGVSPADQARNLEAFLAVLRDAGVIVEAYLDLNDFRIKGDVSKARYLIRGDRLLVDKDGKPERNKNINDAVEFMRREAIERGMFVISADNFATVMGYRRPRSANDSEVSAFRPGLPFGGSGSRPTNLPADKTDKEKEEKKEEKMEKN